MHQGVVRTIHTQPQNQLCYKFPLERYCSAFAVVSGIYPRVRGARPTSSPGPSATKDSFVGQRGGPWARGWVASVQEFELKTNRRVIGSQSAIFGKGRGKCVEQLKIHSWQK